jgi:hypothetical protein
MPRYYFDLCGPSNEVLDNDEYGAVFAGRSDALNHAKRIVNELKDVGGYAPGLMVVMKNEAGQEVASLPLAKGKSHLH